MYFSVHLKSRKFVWWLPMLFCFHWAECVLFILREKLVCVSKFTHSRVDTITQICWYRLTLLTFNLPSKFHFTTIYNPTASALLTVPFSIKIIFMLLLILSTSINQSMNTRFVGRRYTTRSGAPAESVVNRIKKYILESFSECTRISNVVKVG